MKGRINQRFEILGSLGSGGMGEVFEARDITQDKRFALKVLNPETGFTNDQPEILAEFNLLARLKHPNLVQVHECGIVNSGPKSTKGRLFFTMEVLLGRNLAELQRQEQKPKRQHTLGQQVAVGALKGLAAIHDAGIIHRDIKSENIFLTDDGQAKLLDFGLAATAPLPEDWAVELSASPVSSGLSGSVGYWAPEIRRGAPCDARSDLFSLGVTLYRLATQRFPDVRHLIPIAEHSPDWPEPWCRGVEALLASEPRDRPQNAREALALFGVESESPERSLKHLKRPPLIGRQDLLNELLECQLEPANETDNASLIWITGAQGIGKSRLLEELSISLRLRGAIAHLCHPGPGAYSSLRALFHELVLIHKPQGPVTFDLRTLVEGLRSQSLDAITSQDNNERRTAFLDRIARYVFEISERRAIVLLIDDADRIDEASFELIQYLARVAALVKTRFHAVFASEKTDLERDYQRSLNLTPLSQEHSLSLAQLLVGHSDAHELARRCGGFPGAALSDALGQQGRQDSANHPYQQQLQALDARERQVLLALAVLRRPLSVHEWQALTQLDAHELVDAMAILLSQQLVSRIGGLTATKYSLSPPILGELLIQSLEQSQILDFKRHCFEELKTLEAEPEELARLSLEIDSPEAPELCERAAQACLQSHALESAKRFLKEVLRVSTDSAQRRRAQLDVLNLLDQAGDIQEAEAFVRDALDDEDAHHRGRLNKHLSEILRARGQLSGALEALDQALIEFRQSEHETALEFRIEALIYKARIISSMGDRNQARETLQAARDELPEGERLGPLALKIDCEHSNQDALSLENKRYPAAQARLDKALKRFRELNHEEGITLALRSLGLLNFYWQKGEACERYFLEAYKRLEHQGPVALGLLNNLAMVAYNWGDPKVAEWRLEECLNAAERMGAMTISCRGFTNLGRLRKGQDDLGGAIRAFQKAARYARQAQDPVIESAALSELGAAHLLNFSIRRGLEAFAASRQIRIEMGDAARVSTSENELAGLWRQARDIEASISHTHCSLALMAGREDLNLTAMGAEELIRCAQHAGGTAALLRSVRDSNLKPDFPDEILAVYQRGRLTADAALALAAALAADQAGDPALARRILARVFDCQDQDAEEVQKGIFDVSRCLKESPEKQALAYNLRNLNAISEIPNPLGSRIALMKTRVLLNEHQLELGLATLQIIPESVPQELKLERDLLSARIRSRAPQIFEPMGLKPSPEDERPRATFRRVIAGARELGNVVLMAEAASDLAGLEAARRQGHAAQEALVVARDAARGATRDLPLELSEGWSQRLVTSSMELSASASSQDRLMPMIERVLASDVRLEPLLDMVIGLLVDATNAERGFLILKDPEGELAFRSSRNIDRQEVMSSQGFRGSYGIVQWVSENGEPALVADASLDRRFAERGSIRKMQLQSVLAVPIKHKREILAVCYLDHRKIRNCFDEETLDLVSAFTNRIASTLKHSRDQARAIEMAQREAEDYKREIERLGSEHARRTKLIGETPAIRAVRHLIGRFANANAPVLVIGESGTGKEIVARLLHSQSPRQQKTFLAINCAAVSEELLESELFGYRRGAFTGALEDREGVIEAADGGTLFLDEVGDMSLNMQGKLLRVLALSEVRRIGEHHSRKVNVRIIAATHRKLETFVRTGQFREDLYYRLNVLKIETPPLRQRRDDIPLLASHFLRQATPHRPMKLSPGALRELLNAPLHGNVRQLRNIILRASTLCPGEVILKDHLFLETSPEARSEARQAGRKASDSGSSLNARQRAIMDELRTRGGSITTREHCQRQGVSDRTGLRDLKDLVSMGMLIKQGSRKSAKYRLPQ